MNDPFDLQRFVDAQRDPTNRRCRNCAPGENGRTGCGTYSRNCMGWASAMAQRYAISGRDAAPPICNTPARAPPAGLHPGNARTPATSAHRILGSPDDLKFHSLHDLVCPYRAAASLVRRRPAGLSTVSGTGRRWNAWTAADQESASADQGCPAAPPVGPPVAAPPLLDPAAPLPSFVPNPPGG